MRWNESNIQRFTDQVIETILSAFHLIGQIILMFIVVSSQLAADVSSSKHLIAHTQNILYKRLFTFVGMFSFCFHFISRSSLLSENSFELSSVSTWAINVYISISIITCQTFPKCLYNIVYFVPLITRYQWRKIPFYIS